MSGDGQGRDARDVAPLVARWPGYPTTFDLTTMTGPGPFQQPNGADATDFLANFLGAAAPSGGKVVLLPRVLWFVRGGVLVPTNFNSGSIIGQGAGFGTVLVLRDAAGPLLTLGDGVFEPFDAMLRDIRFDANGLAPANGVLFIRRFNLSYIHNVQIVNVTGVGLLGDATVPLWQEMYFERFQVIGLDRRAGSIAMQIAPTGNVALAKSNLENCETALIVNAQTLCKVYVDGSHFERCTRALVLQDCSISGLGVNIPVGAIELGNGCIGGNLEIGPRAASDTENGVSDLGFGNRIVIGTGLRTDGHAQYAGGIDFDGRELLRASDAIDDPLFSRGENGWVGTNATVTSTPAPIISSGKSGRALQVKATAGNGFAAKTFGAKGGTDYLLTIAFVLDATNAANARVQVLSEAAAVIYDSGALDYSAQIGLGNKVRIVRKRIPVAAGAGRKLVVRVYAVNNGQTTYCSLLSLAESCVTMAGNMIGGVAGGAGTDLNQSRDLNAGNISTFRAGYFHKGKLLSYFRASGTLASFGTSGDGNGTASGLQLRIGRGGTLEWLALSPYTPDAAVVAWYAFGAAPGSTLTVSDVCLVPVYDDDLPEYMLVDQDTTPSVVAGPRTYLVDNQAATVITFFDDGEPGQVIRLRFTNANTTLTNGATLKLSGAVNFVSTADDTMTLEYDGAVWREMGRSIN